MKRMVRSGLLFVLGVWAAFAPPASAQLVKVGRWLEYDGAKPYVVGFDAQQLAADPSVNYTNKLDSFRKYGVNKVRIWIYPYFGGSSYFQPWPYNSGTGRFDIGNWDNAYWTRVKAFVAAAQARDILVEATIFAPNNLLRSQDWNHATFKTVWNKNFNNTLAGVFSANGSGHFLPQFFTLGHTEAGVSLQGYQQALVDKTTSELGGYDNVFFEIANEYPLENAAVADANAAGIVNWHKHWIDRVATNAPSRLVTAHAQQGWGPNTTGIQNYWSYGNVDVLDFHFQDYANGQATPSPEGISTLLHDAQTRGKVLTINESGDYVPSPDKLNDNTRMAWGMLLAGGYFSFYQDDSGDIGDANWKAAALRLQALRAVAESIDFAQLSPVNGAGVEHDALLSGGPGGGNRQLMANPGQRYLAYFWGTPTSSPASLTLAAGTYQYTWHDARNATAIGCGEVTGGGVASIPAPSTSAWDGAVGVALAVRKIAGTGRLSACVTTSPATKNLETEAGLDWAHWGLDTAASFNSRSLSKALTTYTPLGGGTAVRFTDAQVAFSWSGGTPTATASNSTTGLAVSGVGNGFRLTVPAVNVDRVLRLYLGAWNGRGRLHASLSDGSAPDLVDLSVNSDAAGDDLVYTVKFRSAAASATLTLDWTVEYDLGGGVTLEAVTLGSI